MSEISKNVNGPNNVISKSSKQKHNSKRRAKKNKASVKLNDGLEIKKVDQVENQSCSTLRKNDREIFSESNHENILKEGPGIVGLGIEQNHNQKLKFNATQKSSSSSKDLCNAFQNLKICASNKPINSNKITNNLKKSKSESLSVKDVKNLKQNESKKSSSLNKKKTCIPNENVRKFVNLVANGNSSRSSVLSQIDSSSMKLVSEIEQTFCLKKSVGESLKSKNLNKNFNAEASKIEENNPSVPLKSTSNIIGNSLRKYEVQKSDGKFQEKKAKNKKDIELLGEKKIPNWNQRVFMNSDFQKTCSSLPLSSKSNESNITKKKKPSLKSSPIESNMEYPPYLSREKLQSLSECGVLLNGLIRINHKNYKEAYIVAQDNGMDILIEGLRDRNRALEGDEVYYVLKAKEHHRVNADNSGTQRTAVVVGIKSFNHKRGAVGTLNPIGINYNFALFTPRDLRLPRIRIKRNNWPTGFSVNCNAFKNKLYFARISQWNNVKYADGEILKEVGTEGELETESDAILLRFGLDFAPYTEALKRYMPSSNFKISECDMINREDFRKQCIFSIDPQTAMDLDDAIGCQLLPNGNLEVGVHISDVSYFLEEKTPLDKVVSERATTIYLVQKTYHMLPVELCRLCSLAPGEDKLSFSVLWEVTPDCRIVSHRFTRSIINSCAQLSYDQVQAVIDNSTEIESAIPEIYGNFKIENIKEIIMSLHKIAVGLRSRRFKNGALRIEQKKITFTLDENKLPVAFKEKTHKSANQLIEEFMLLANITVAEKLNSSFPQLAFLRAHPPPIPYMLEKLQKNLLKYGITFDVSSSGAVQASLSKYTGTDSESIARMLVLNNALTKPMARAKYYCGGLLSADVDRRHYALNIPIYTHFTSPLRRYADIIVHRLLGASLTNCKSLNWKPEQVELVASICNKQKYAAKLAQEMSTDFYFALYVELQGTVTCEAIVSDIKEKCFDCIGLSTGISQRIYYETIKGKYKREKVNGIPRLLIEWPKDKNHCTEEIQIIQIFSSVMIELRRVNVLKIEAKLLRISEEIK